MTPRFLLAKYAPDLARMEPRNIGVIVWWKGDFSAKFLPSKDARFVNEIGTYERWVHYWSQMIAEGEIRPTRSRPVSKENPECIEALLKTQKGNYMLVESGELLKPIKKKELVAVAESLYGDLVATADNKSGSSGSFSEQCESTLNRARIEYTTRRPIKCKWHGVERVLHPDYCIGNGQPEGVLQRVAVAKEASVNNSAHILDRLMEDSVVRPDACRVLIRESDIGSKSSDRAAKLFENMCGVINIEGKSAQSELVSFRNNLAT